jgi:hypothetical protein
MLATTLRTATVADVMTNLQTSTYPRTDVIALGWGMGNAQNGIHAACVKAASMGLLTLTQDYTDYVELTPYGKEWTPEPVFTLTYRTSNGPAERVLTAHGIERIGAVVLRLANRDMASDIEVRNESGEDVTFDFRCFA